MLALVAIILSCRDKAHSPCSSGPGLKSAGFGGESLNQQELALTFTVPSGDTPLMELSDFLTALGVEGAFFVNGGAAAELALSLQHLKASGHLIGNSGFLDQPFSASADLVRSVRKTDELLLPAITGNIFLLSDPGHSLSAEDADALNAAGLSRYVGDVRADIGFLTQAEKDACFAQGLEACALKVLETTRQLRRGIATFGAVDERSTDLLRFVLTKLRDEGWSFVRIDSVPDIKVALIASGATPGVHGGAGGCSDY